MMIPTITDIIAVIKTAPAAISFIFLICSFLERVTTSDKFSIDVFINSDEITKPMQTIIANHSEEAMRKRKPKMVTRMIIAQ